MTSALVVSTCLFFFCVKALVEGWFGGEEDVRAAGCAKDFVVASAAAAAEQSWCLSFFFVHVCGKIWDVLRIRFPYNAKNN